MPQWAILHVRIMKLVHNRDAALLKWKRQKVNEENRAKHAERKMGSRTCDLWEAEKFGYEQMFGFWTTCWAKWASRGSLNKIAAKKALWRRGKMGKFVKCRRAPFRALVPMQIRKTTLVYFATYVPSRKSAGNWIRIRFNSRRLGKR